MHLFVYGTLQRGHGLNDFLTRQGGKFVGMAHTEDNFSMFRGGFKYGSHPAYPVVLANPAMGQIVGELYHLPENYNFHTIDQIEGAYDRTSVNVVAEDGNTYTAYMYIGKVQYWGQNNHKDRLAKPHEDGKIYWILPAPVKASRATETAT